MPSDNCAIAWILTFATSAACISGASMLFLDKIVMKFTNVQGQHRDSWIKSPSFTSCSLSLSAGVMIFSSFNILLPNARSSFEHSLMMHEITAGVATLGLYFVGIIGMALLNSLLCSKHIHNHDQLKIESGTGRKPSFSYGSIPPNPPSVSSERTKLLREETVELESQVDEQAQREHLRRMGFQTALAISLHKFPEGLFTFLSTTSSPTLGFSLFLPIAVHNFVEGVTIALPLYIGTGSRRTAFFYTILMGGLSQPLGALIGAVSMWWLGEKFRDGLRPIIIVMIPIIFAIVSGMMCYIAIQSMLPYAVKNDHKGKFVAYGFFSGIAIMGLISALLNE
ncbi:uncharacterized protein VTP21DRAFT_1273 [Calcarisporiella thermophila]|uniref:uncharacterized protein n=1 Tax=Calcarisporiella thermophila TaxID=911321 RepID=UPI0037443EE4